MMGGHLGQGDLADQGYHRMNEYGNHIALGDVGKGPLVACFQVEPFLGESSWPSDYSNSDKGALWRGPEGRGEKLPRWFRFLFKTDRFLKEEGT